MIKRTGFNLILFLILILYSGINKLSGMENDERSKNYYTIANKHELFYSKMVNLDAALCEESKKYKEKHKEKLKKMFFERSDLKGHSNNCLKGPFLDANSPGKPIYCTQSPWNNSYTQWRLEKTRDSEDYKIINIHHEKEREPSIITEFSQNKIELTDGKSVDEKKIKWNIKETNEEKNEFTQKFFTITNKCGNSLFLKDNGFVSIGILEPENDKFKWVFFMKN